MENKDGDLRFSSAKYIEHSCLSFRSKT